MPALTLRAILTAVLLLSIGDVVLAQPKPAPALGEDNRMLPYVEPGQLIDIGGRRINLQCMGTANGPTVVLMAGIFSWSLIWYKTQPVIAQKTRVCAFDRAPLEYRQPRRGAPYPILRQDLELYASRLGAAFLARGAPDHQRIRSRHSVG
jgi:hypothetical protein